MDNYVIVKDEAGNNIKIEVLFSFRVSEFNKEYVAYTLNDDGVSEIEAVFISEMDPTTKKLISIPFEQKEFVLQAYNETKNMIMNDK